MNQKSLTQREKMNIHIMHGMKKTRELQKIANEKALRHISIRFMQRFGVHGPQIALAEMCKIVFRVQLEHAFRGMIHGPTLGEPSRDH